MVKRNKKKQEKSLFIDYLSKKKLLRKQHIHSRFSNFPQKRARVEKNNLPPPLGILSQLCVLRFNL